MLPAADCPIVSRYPIPRRFGTTRGVGAIIQLQPGPTHSLLQLPSGPFPYGPYDLKMVSRLATTNQENSVRMASLNQLLEPCSHSSTVLSRAFSSAISMLHLISITRMCRGQPPLAPFNAGLRDSYRTLHATNRTFPTAFAYNEPGITWTPKTSQGADGVFDRLISFTILSPTGRHDHPSNSTSVTASIPAIGSSRGAFHIHA